ncbi:hypothetical protein [Kribbella sp. NPDC000426]|uniref:hypothetical protein n=1 Tax=Kribbella sp. NPDC000426 TaxID=3154255 RepID=UPI00331F2FD3
MKIYRVFWLVFCGVLGLLGAVVAFSWSLANVIMLVVMAALMGSVVAVIVLADPDGPSRSPRERRGIIAVTTALSAAGTLAFIGLGTLLGAATALLLVVVLAALSPYTIRYCVRWLTEHGHLVAASPAPVHLERADWSATLAIAPIAETRPHEEAKPYVAPDALSDEALCLAWRASFSALQKAGSPAEQLRIADERRAYLDEIERRTTHGMAAWLASGPRAAGDPSRFVLGDGAAGRARINWDDLFHDMGK